MRRSVCLFFLLLASACGGKLQPLDEELAFTPQHGSSGYGFVGGLHASLVEDSPESKVMKLSLSDISGSFHVDAGSTVTLTEVDAQGHARELSAESGTVTATFVGGAKVQIEVDVRMVDPSDDAHVFHVHGTYLADLDYIG